MRKSVFTFGNTTCHLMTVRVTPNLGDVPLTTPPSGRTMALGWTRPLTKMSTRDIKMR